MILQLAKASIEHGFLHDSALFVNEIEIPKNLTEIYSSFVSIKVNNRIRGCIGNPFEPCKLYQSILFNSFKAAFKDDRFSKLNKNVLKDTIIEIYILKNPKSWIVNNPEMFASTILQHHTLSLSAGNLSATILNSYQTNYKSNIDFMNAVKEKAGITTTWDNIVATFHDTTLIQKPYSEIPSWEPII